MISYLPGGALSSLTGVIPAGRRRPQGAGGFCWLLFNPYSYRYVPCLGVGTDLLRRRMMLSGMRERALLKIHRRISRYVRSRYELIKPEPTQGLFNHKCFDNCAQYAFDHRGLEVYEVMVIDQGEPFLHYVNYDPERRAYLETTLGYLADQMEYYKIRRIHPDDVSHIGSEFSRSLACWLEQHTNWFQREILEIEKVV